MNLSDNLIVKISKQYNIEIYNVQQINTQDNRAIWEANTDKGILTIRTFDKTHSLDEIQQDLDILKFLEENDFYAPSLIKTHDAHDSIQCEDLHIALTSFIEGNVSQQTPDTFSKLGKVTATLHLLGEKYLRSPLIKEARWQPKITIPQLNNYRL